MRKRLIISDICPILIILAALCFLVTEAESADAVKTLNVGCTLALNVPIGVDAKRSIDIIVGGINDSGGLVIKGEKYKVNVIIYDDGWSADKGRAAAERLIYRDKVKYIIGVCGSQAAAAIVDVTEKNKVILMAGCASNKIIGPGTRYSFRCAFQRSFVVPGMQFLLTKSPNTKTVLIVAPDDEGGKASVPIWMDIVPRFGVSADVLYHPFGETDFGPLAVKITRMNPDIVNPVASQGGMDLGLTLKALNAAGYKGKVFSSSTVSMDKVSQIASNETSEGTLCQVTSYDNPNAPNYIKEFKEKFVAKNGRWTDLHPTWLTAWGLFFAAVKKADSVEPDDIAAAMKGLKFDALIGEGCLMAKGKFGVQNLPGDRYSDTVVPMNYGSIKNGKIVWEKLVTAEEIVKLSEPFFGEKWVD